MIISSLVNFIRNLVSWSSVEGQVFFWYPLIRFLTSSCLAGMQRLLNRFGHISNGIVFYCSTIFWICSIPEARSWIERVFDNEIQKPYDIWNLLLFLIWFIASELYLATLLRSSQLNSHKRQISSTSLQLFRDWNKIWKPRAESISVIGALFRLFKWELIAIGVLKLISDILIFAVPFMLYFYINLFNQIDTHLWKGIGVSIIVAVIIQIRCLISNYCFMVGSQIGGNVETTLGTVIYKKVG